ncbi:uncharacterized protein LAESUDRAFT_644492 [Laetiporus sulphureus 93-53]|uniref:Wings apart-like protein C-terminal domain-containing protein n=1 Tax=Laetiporus sulphureus 93-53 TaxID=1314785 RepID=A0A165GKD8_9APHY|nr:uncharacterized protein LAESUDRAFT_644492 [Laetiporus sulphureus 93-53]KZT10474.1 hypothetical protein LAESUDRAFT_644492 [Laetiporus sulphureus 93-53]
MLRRTNSESASRDSRAGRSSKPSSIPHTPQKIAKTRSETVIDLTIDSPSTLSRSSSASKSQPVQDISSPALHPSTRPGPSSTMRTYAGKSRSFLVALSAPQLGTPSRTNSGSQALDDDDGDMHVQEEDLENRESYTDLRTRWGVDESEDDPRPASPPLASQSEKGKRKGKGKPQDVHAPSLPNGMMNDLKSITELRSKGESRRFLDEVGYIFEGLDAESLLSVRRGSALEIVTKFCDVDFARRAKAADFLGRAWEALREAGAGDGDKILDCILVFFVALVSRDPRDIEDLATRTDFLPLLYKMLSSLERKNDPLWFTSSLLNDAVLKQAGITRVEKTLLTSLEKLVRKKSGMLCASEPVCNRVLISMTLSALFPAVHNERHFPCLLKSLSSEIRPIASRIPAYASGLGMLPALSSSTYLDSWSFLHTDNCLRLLDSFLLGRWERSEGEENSDARLDAQREGELGSSLVGLCIACDVISRDSLYPDQCSQARRCLESVLRVLINMTHDDLPWCQKLLSEPLTLPTIIRLITMSHRDYVGTMSNVKREAGADDVEDHGNVSSSLDRLCLALGLLTNLIQECQEVKDALRLTSASVTCPGQRACIIGCRCTARISALGCLAEVYAQYCSFDDTLASVLRGHMAVLFGMLMQGSPENRRLLLKAFPGASDEATLDALVEHARSFTSFYLDFTKRVSAVVESQDDADAIGNTETWDVELDNDVSRLLRDGQGETLAQEAVAFLETLRDETRSRKR